MDARANQVADALSITSSDGTVIGLRVFPNEPAFVEDVRRAAGAISVSSIESDEDQRQALEAELRVSYPDLEVRIREELASLGAGDRAWYVLRDGLVSTDVEAGGPVR